ncbi:hypothetical protein BUALT_Bualt17G0023400 [Buddleja alternifolia]|uniref:Reverse transcriptase zinc-binding domain-containing protein n=1 Tax=Buddleja alternifolia TaxID=168488 RepID=A0AAV6WBW1_9LAMI|nr:hypothetical protein BUALT_Bualt17G0023400 [Buddleja alternifolia]
MVKTTIIHGAYSSESAWEFLRDKEDKKSWYAVLRGPDKIPRNLFILWLATKEKLSTKDKPWIALNNNFCCLCNSQLIESDDRLFFQFSTKWRDKHLINIAQRMLLASTVYNTWRERNERTLNGKCNSANEVAKQAIEIVKNRLITLKLKDSIRSLVLGRVWNIAW